MPLSSHSLGQWIFLLVSSISCQHGSLHRANSEVEEKCSLSRLFPEPFHNGLFLPATFPQDALTTCQRAIWHLNPWAVQITRSSTGLSSFLLAIEVQRYKGKPVPRGPLTPPASYLLATHRKETSRQPLPPTSSLVRTKQRKLFKPLQNLARDRLCSLLIT